MKDMFQNELFEDDYVALMTSSDRRPKIFKIFRINSRKIKALPLSECENSTIVTLSGRHLLKLTPEMVESFNSAICTDIFGNILKISDFVIASGWPRPKPVVARVTKIHVSSILLKNIEDGGPVISTGCDVIKIDEQIITMHLLKSQIKENEVNEHN